MAIYVSEPGRPLGTRVPEIFRDRPVDTVTEMVEYHPINPQRNDATDPEVLNAQWSAHRRAAAVYGENTGVAEDSQRPYLPVSRLATTTLHSLPTSTTLAEALSYMESRAIRHLIVVTEHNEVAGLVDKPWILEWLRDNKAEAAAYNFSLIELPAFLTVAPETDAHQLARLMLAHRLDAAVVIDAQSLVVGIVTSTDYLRLYASPSQQEGNV
ncbi:CBS domain-containing protein [Marinobacter sp. SS21]|uniref:CBS domain-containing protein n=1 Tax=Marinobacter sp. SS21 TaxID=2979460 RepID=UPI00232B0DB5|nr:CBS domain-containing protein [Marinobacter sp. SS21]MDC0663345.1 CBS domain-containing protein [Marinobacter sp. SS21]